MADMRTLLVFSGAGLSAESGIPTYRDHDGLWRGIDPQSVATREALVSRPELVREFCNERRAAIGRAQPNPAHQLLARWQQRYPGARLITQNVDDLLERAGCTDVMHVHGRYTHMRCEGCGLVWELGYAAVEAGERCPRARCKSRKIRPAIVFFHETAPLYRDMYRAIGKLERDDVLVVIGTTGAVVDIGALARPLRCHKLLVNLNPSPELDERIFDWVRMAPVCSVLDELDDEVQRLLA
jgi:NAD-dependent deacetylase